MASSKPNTTPHSEPFWNLLTWLCQTGCHSFGWVVAVAMFCNGAYMAPTCCLRSSKRLLDEDIGISFMEQREIQMSRTGLRKHSRSDFQERLWWEPIRGLWGL